jgi:hypothetical protein
MQKVKHLVILTNLAFIAMNCFIEKSLLTHGIGAQRNEAKELFRFDQVQGPYGLDPVLQHHQQLLGS